MALALVKKNYRAIIGTSPDTISFEFNNKMELERFLAKYASSAGAGVVCDLYEVTYSWNDSTKKFESASEAIDASDLQ